MSYRIGTTKAGSRTVHQLFDDTSGASASILASFGFNLFDLRLPVAGSVRSVVVSSPGWAESPASPGRNGVPILFPFPNRIKDARYSFGGKSYTLPANSGSNAIHGFAIQADWEVVDHAVTPLGASITGRYQISRQSPEMLDHWPSDAVIQVRYTLAGRRLDMETVVSNPTADDLPFGFGIHPYFRLPFAPGEDTTRTSVVIPASEFWELDGFVPTGRRVAVDPRLDFRKGQPIAGLQLDDVLTGIDFQGDRAVCRLVDETLKAEFRLDFDRNFREIVVYTPPKTGDVIAIEPYTQTTDAIHLMGRGIDGGLRVLKHGQSATLSIGFETIG